MPTALKSRLDGRLFNSKTISANKTTSCFVRLKSTYSLFLWMKMYQFNVTALKRSDVTSRYKKTASMGGHLTVNLFMRTKCMLR